MKKIVKFEIFFKLQKIRIFIKNIKKRNSDFYIKKLKKLELL